LFQKWGWAAKVKTNLSLKLKVQSAKLKRKANSKIIPNYFKVFQIIPNQYQNSNVQNSKL